MKIGNCKIPPQFWYHGHVSEKRFLIGIDEVGRGPLAGPVAVGAVAVPYDFDWTAVLGVRDSKKLSPRSREAWNRKIQTLRLEKKLNFSVSFSSAQMIDRRGIVFAIRSALVKCLKQLGATPRNCEILLDGSLYAPKNFHAQKTIIGGDDLEPVISMASIVAKVRRDKLMRNLAIRYPKYGLEFHKGYGTRRHYEALQKFGLCKIHRSTFI